MDFVHTIIMNILLLSVENILAKLFAHFIENVSNKYQEIDHFIGKNVPGKTLLFTYFGEYHDGMYFPSELNKSEIVFNKYCKQNHLDRFMSTQHKYDLSYVIVVNDTASLKEHTQFLEEQLISSRGQIFLILYNKLISESDVIYTLRLLQKMNVYNIIIYDTKNFFTWYPFAHGNRCGTFVHVVKIKDLYFPTRSLPRVLDGCRFNVTWQYFYPSLIDPSSETNPGSLVRFVRALGAAMNVSIEFLKGIERIDLRANGTLSQIIEDMFKRNIDIGIQVFAGRQLPEEIDLSCPLIFTGMHVVLPPRKKVSSNSITRLYSFWYALIANGVISCLTFKILFKKNVFNAVFSAIRFNLQSQLNENIAGTTSRLSLSSLFIALIALNTFFSSVLSSILTKPIYAQKIESVEDLLVADVKVKCYKFLLFYENRLSTQWLDAGNEEYPTLTKAFVTERNHALAIDFIDMAFLKNPEQVDKITLPLYGTYNLFTRRGYPVKEVFDYWIMNIFESGLHIKWIEDSARTVEHFVVKNNPEFEKVALQLEHLSTAFYILLGGLLCSTIVFSFEILCISLVSNK